MEVSADTTGTCHTDYGTIRVAIIDDHPLVREGLRRVFGPCSDIEVAGEAASAADGIVMVEQGEFDVVLLDFRLPDGDGVSVLKALSSSGCDVKVVMLTCMSDARHVRSAIDHGACAYLTKGSADHGALIETVRKASRGVSSVSSDALTSLLSNVRDHSLEHVTAREREVWSLMADGRSNDEIAATLFLSERTVKFHVGNILRKTGARSRAEAVSLAFTSGLKDCGS